MIERIIDSSIRNKPLVMLLVAAACIWGAWTVFQSPVDAIPDLGQTQVIIFSRWDRSPDLIEDQITYPIVSAMTGAPRVRTVRGISDFGSSYIYVIFEDGTDIYWARSRTLEYLAGITSQLPAGAKTEIGPDATSLGWVFQYALIDESGQHNLGELRSYQDWYLKYYLKAVPGVAEVASLGGFTQQYQVNVDPNRLRARNLSITQVADAVRTGNSETGARLIEFGGAEYMIRGRGYARSREDIENIVLSVENGSPIRIRDVANVVVGPDIRRGVSDLDGRGEVVTGIVIARESSDVLEVIRAVKQKLQDMQPGMPTGMKVVPVYDRSDLIERTISNSKRTLLEVIVTVVLVILVFLRNLPNALIPVLTIPIAALLAFIPLGFTGTTINIMSLAGIAIACGALVDAAIIIVEQSHKKLEAAEATGRPFDPAQVVTNAVKEVAGPTFFSLLVIAVAFLPVLALEGEEGKLFRPLAYTKSFAMLAAAILALTFDPALRLFLVRFQRRRETNDSRGFLRSSLYGRMAPEETHPITGPLIRVYDPIVRWTLRSKRLVLAGAAALMLITVPVAFQLQSEFMPAVDEGSLLYMPSTMPGISIAQAEVLVRATDRILMRFPEVDHVLGKAGRADTATDPAPLSMLESTIVLKPKSAWRKIPTWYSSWAPGWLAAVLRHVTPDTLSTDQLVAEMDQALQIPGLANSWTMPIRGRLEMLSTGIRTPVGLKIQGSDLNKVQALGLQIEKILRKVPGTRSVFAERTGTGYFLDVQWDRPALARYGLSIDQAQQSLSTAVGGDNISTILGGRERFPINVRYLPAFRSDLTSIGKVLVISGSGQQIPLSRLAALRMLTGPAMIRDENGLLTGYVFIDVGGRPANDYVADAKRALGKELPLPATYAIQWSGQYESAQRTRDRLMLVIPLTIGIILALLYLNTRSWLKTMLVALAVPFSAIGAIWFLHLLGYHMSVAVWVGLIALLGIDAETGVFMLLYLDLAHSKAKSEGTLGTLKGLHDAIVNGAAKRLRPKFMTFATMFVGLIPLLWSTGAGSEITKRVAAPMIGGILTSFLLELLIYPVLYAIWRERNLRTIES